MNICRYIYEASKVEQNKSSEYSDNLMTAMKLAKKRPKMNERL